LRAATAAEDRRVPSLCAQAGLRPEDVITKIDGEPATSNIQLQELTLTKKPGDTVSIEYARDGQSATATVTLSAQP
jgi:putative serine protease PepD